VVNLALDTSTNEVKVRDVYVAPACQWSDNVHSGETILAAGLSIGPVTE